MRNLITIIFSFLIFPNAYSSCSLENSNTSKMEDIINSCYQKSRIKKLDFLPQFITEKNERCEFYSKNSSSYRDCQIELIRFSEEVLQCENLISRKKQMADYDSAQFEYIQNKFSPAKIPNDLQNKIYSMAKTLNIEVDLAAYQSNILNAHAGANNKILLSSGLWEKNSVLSNDEVMAVIAHELAHVKENHSLKLGCLALEWSGSILDLEEALTVFREDFSLETSRGQSFSRTSKSIEFRADELSVELLYRSQYSPRLMGDALEKLNPKSEGGFSTGSHPDIQSRINKAYEHAEKFKQK